MPSRSRLSTNRLALTLALAALALLAPSAASAGFTTCGVAPGFECGYLSVPLDRTGVVPGNVNLYVERKTGASPEGALIVLAGGPGQAATSVTPDWLAIFGPVLAGRELVVFDQRGTGNSGALDCQALDQVASQADYDRAIQTCADNLGAARGLYATSDSVDDIDSVRQAIGADKIALAGVSYGTKVALDYAARYPQHVDRLVLDSVVLPVKDVFNRSTFQAVGPVLDAICAGRCAGITRSASADLATLVALVRMDPLRGAVVLPNGHRLAATLDELDLIGLMYSGDFDPVLRAALPAALRAALDGDSAPILRLLLWSSVGEGIGNAGEFSTMDNLATLCEDSTLPWPRTSATADHMGLAQNAVDALSASAFAPFDTQAALALPPLSECARWPQTPALPALTGGALPDVPTLILSGDEDVRTPRADARQIATQLPRSRLVAVPDTGHSVLTTDPGDCARRAVAGFFADRPVADCRRSPHVLSLAPIAPSFSQVRAAPRTRGRDGRTLAAVLATLADVRRGASEAIFEWGSPNADLEFGGLRGGRVSGRPARTLKLGDVVYIAGVKLSGTVAFKPAVRARLTVSGPGVARGTIAIARGKVDARFGKLRLRTPLAHTGVAAHGAAIRVSPRSWNGRTWWSSAPALPDW